MNTEDLGSLPVIVGGTTRVGRTVTIRQTKKAGGALGTKKTTADLLKAHMATRKKTKITITVSANEDNLCKVFFSIKKKINDIIADYDNVSYLAKPAVPIGAIAKKFGIKVSKVNPKKIYYLHAILDESDKKHVVIKVNKDDSEAEQRFSIAHELGHYFRTKTALLKKADVFKNAKPKKEDVLEKTGKLFSLINKKAFAARSSLNSYEKVIKYMEKIEDAKFIADYMTETVSENLGKDVPTRQAYKEWAKALFEGTISKTIARGGGSYNKKNKTGVKGGVVRNKEELVLYLTNRLYEEELADYFAANLLVPLERFQLWEHKADRTIAKAFNVSLDCIRKRRQEAKSEREYFTKYLSSGDRT